MKKSLTIYLPDAQLRVLKSLAAAEDRSLSNFISRKLSEVCAPHASVSGSGADDERTLPYTLSAEQVDLEEVISSKPARPPRRKK